MRLLLLGTSPGARGTETHLIALARGLAEMGAEVAAVAHPEGEIARALRPAGIPVEPAIFRNALDPRGWGPLGAAVARHRPDWLLASFGQEYWPAALRGLRSGVRVGLFRHLTRPLNPLSRKLLPRVADRFFAVSEFVRQGLLAQGIPGGQVQLLYNPIDLGRFRPPADPAAAAARRELGFGPMELVVGFAGPLNAAKGGLRFARALEAAMREDGRLRGLWVCPEREHPRLLGRLSPDLRGRHVLRGWTAEVERLYGAMDVLAVPSEWQEPFGRVSIEAQACGVPVLASRVGGLPETIAANAGWLVEPADEAAWTKAVLAFAALPEAARREAKEAGLRGVARYGERLIAEELLRLLATPAPR